jgi:phospho-N-acetylmuramoyl-pentapeptide-transferase
MHFYLGILLLSFGVTFLLMIPFIGLLYKLKFTRKNEAGEVRKNASQEFYKIREMQASKPVLVTGGGILVSLVVAVFFGIVAVARARSNNLFSGHQLWGELMMIFFTFLGFGILGLFDDVIKIFGFAKTGFFGLRMRYKFMAQWILAFGSAFILYQVLGVNIINVPFFGLFKLGVWMVPIGAFLIVAFANSFDITDGLDGLSCGLLMICLLAFWAISLHDLDHVLSLFIAVWIGSLLAYLYFNIYPARIMLGNVGGLAFGATLAVIGLLSGKIVALVIIGGVFVAEGMSSTLQLLSKKFFKRRLFPIAPIHHWLQLIGWEEPKIVARAWLAGLGLAIFGVWLAVL